MNAYPVSTESSDLFTANSRTSFTNILPERLDDSYTHVSLEEIHLENSYSTVCKPPDNLPSIILQLPFLLRRGNNFADSMIEAVGRNDLKDKSSTVYLTMKDSKYLSIDLLIKKIHSALAALRVDGKVKFQFDKSNKCTIEHDVTSCFISAELLLVLGYKMFPNMEISPSSVKSHVKELEVINTMSDFRYVKIENGLTKASISNGNLRVYLPRVIKVECDNILPVINGSKMSQFLNTAPGPRKNAGMFTHEFVTSACHPLNERMLNKMSFKILDHNDKALKLVDGSATYLQIKFHKMDGSTTTNLTLFSNDVLSAKLFKINTSTNFVTKLPQTLHRSGKSWSLNLTQMYLPSKIYNITSDICTMTVVSILGGVRKVAVSQLPHGHFPTVAELVHHFNEITFGKHSIYMNIDDNRITFTNATKGNLTFNFHPIMDMVLGLTKTVDETGSIISLTTMATRKADYIYDIAIGRPRYARVICEEAARTIYGSTMQRLLRFVTLKHSENDEDNLSHYQFYKDCDTEIQYSSIDMLSIKLLCENNDQAIQFKDNAVPTSFNIEIKHNN